jgi:hypothetical protein
LISVDKKKENEKIATAKISKIQKHSCSSVTSGRGNVGNNIPGKNIPQKISRKNVQVYWKNILTLHMGKNIPGRNIQD